jgi:hypothetical protein
MAMIDPEQERQRLAEFYARQTNEELEKVAAEAYELTELAREALRSELSHRGLYTGQLDEPDPRPAEASPEFRNLVTIRSFWYLAEAELAKGLLDAAGIESFLFDENIVGLGWYANAVHGVKLRVDVKNAGKADQILKEQVLKENLIDDDSVTPGGTDQIDPDSST